MTVERLLLKIFGIILSFNIRPKSDFTISNAE